MKIKQTGSYDNYHGFDKQFIVIEYCCTDMARDMKENRSWYIENGEMQCWDYESGFSGKYCSHCGEKIEIIE